MSFVPAITVEPESMPTTINRSYPEPTGDTDPRL
jgi:hypothetical protein